MSAVPRSRPDPACPTAGGPIPRAALHCAAASAADTAAVREPQPTPGGANPTAAPRRALGARGADFALTAFLCVCALAVAASLAARLWPVGVADAVVRLEDGDLERSEREAMLAIVLRGDGGADGGADAAAPGLAAAMAAVALGDEPAYRRRCGARPLPFAAPPPPASLQRAALGDPVLRALLLAMAAEAAGDPQARVLFLYERAAQSSALFGMQFARRLAEAGLQRLPR